MTRVLEEVDKVRCFAPSRQVVRAESWVPTSASSVQRPRITVVLRRVVGTGLSVECPTTVDNGRFAPSRGCRPPRQASNDRETVVALSRGCLASTLNVRRSIPVPRVAYTSALITASFSVPPRKFIARRRRGKSRPGKRHRDRVRARAAAQLTLTPAVPVLSLPPPTVQHSVYDPVEAVLLPNFSPRPLPRERPSAISIPALLEPPTEPLPLPEELFRREPATSPRAPVSSHVLNRAKKPPTPGKWYDPLNFDPADLPEDDVLFIPIESSPERFGLTPTKSQPSVKRSLFLS